METESAETDNVLLDVIVKAYEQILSKKELESAKALKNEQVDVRKNHQI